MNIKILTIIQTIIILAAGCSPEQKGQPDKEKKADYHTPSFIDSPSLNDEYLNNEFDPV